MYSSYTADDIEVLEGLEPVRRRPGMTKLNVIINRYKAEKQPVLQAFNQAFCAAMQYG